MKNKTCKKIINGLKHNHKDAIRCSNKANSKDGYCNVCYQEKIKYSKEYYKENKEVILTNQVFYRVENKEKIHKKGKRYYRKNKKILLQKMAKRYSENIEYKTKARIQGREYKRKYKELALLNCKKILDALGLSHINHLDLTDNRFRSLLIERFIRNEILAINEYAIRDLNNPRLIYEIDICFPDIKLLVEGKVTHLTQHESTILRQHKTQIEKIKSEGLIEWSKYQYSVDGSVFGNSLLDLYKVLLSMYQRFEKDLITYNIMAKSKFLRIIKFLKKDISALEKIKEYFINNAYSRTQAISNLHLIK